MYTYATLFDQIVHNTLPCCIIYGYKHFILVWTTSCTQALGALFVCMCACVRACVRVYAGVSVYVSLCVRGHDPILLEA